MLSISDPGPQPSCRNEFFPSILGDLAAVLSFAESSLKIYYISLPSSLCGLLIYCPCFLRGPLHLPYPFKTFSLASHGPFFLFSQRDFLFRWSRVENLFSPLGERRGCRPRHRLCFFFLPLARTATLFSQRASVLSFFRVGRLLHPLPPPEQPSHQTG